MLALYQPLAADVDTFAENLSKTRFLRSYGRYAKEGWRHLNVFVVGLRWTPQDHAARFPKHFRDQVFTLLLCLHRNHEDVVVGRDILKLIVSQLWDQYGPPGTIVRDCRKAAVSGNSLGREMTYIWKEKQSWSEIEPFFQDTRDLKKVWGDKKVDYVVTDACHDFAEMGDVIYADFNDYSIESFAEDLDGKVLFCWHEREEGDPVLTGEWSRVDEVDQLLRRWMEPDYLAHGKTLSEKSPRQLRADQVFLQSPFCRNASMHIHTVISSGIHQAERNNQVEWAEKWDPTKLKKKDFDVMSLEQLEVLARKNRAEFYHETNINLDTLDANEEMREKLIDGLKKVRKKMKETQKRDFARAEAEKKLNEAK
jgi:hypothetical protein